MKLSRIVSLFVGSAAGMLASSGSSAHALVFNVNGTDYDVTTVTGTYNSLAPQLQSQIWWGNATLANDFADNVSLGLGVQNPNTFGPSFAFTYDEVRNLVFVAYTDGSSLYNIEINDDDAYSFAVATPVPFDIPGGATIPTVGSLFALALMRKVKKTIASKTHITNSITKPIGYEYLAETS